MHVCTVYIYTILKYLYNDEWLIEIILYHIVIFDSVM